MNSMSRDLAGNVTAAYALANTAVTAGASADGEAVNGASIDTAGLSSRANTLAFAIAITATFAGDETAKVVAKIQDSADNSAWADVVAAQDVITLAGDDATVTGAGVIGLDLGRSRRYIRVVATPSMSATATSTMAVSAVALLAGLDQIGG